MMVEDDGARSVPTALSLRQLGKVFRKGDEAVHIEGLDIRSGEFVTLVGPSGCGKTTTMRMIAGLEDPSEGEIFFGGRIVNDVPVQKRNIAMVFQNYALYPHLRVSENLEYGLRKRGMPRSDRQKKVQWVADLLRITSLLDRKPRQLSGGEQQRVALGRAIIRTPDVLLLDEPLSNLDAKLRTLMRVELVKLQRRIGCTTIFVTHDQLEAMTMSDRIAVMSQGRIQQFATPAEIYDRPANLFVGGFIGSPPMNFLRGELIADGDDMMFTSPAAKVCLTRQELGGIVAVPSDRKAVLGIRPENISLCDSAGAGMIAGVSAVELVGAEKYVFLETDDGPVICRETPDATVAPGNTVGILLRKDRVRLFSATSGEALGIESRLPG